jgi:hypothetical protein
MAHSVTTTDLYEATYYLLGGCRLEAIETVRLGGAVSCRLTFRGEKLPGLQSEYFAGEATVPLLPFRRSFGQINALIYSTKKKARSRLKRERREAGGAP